MRAFLIAIISTALAAASPTPDLVAIAKSGREVSLEMVLDARFDPAGDARFVAFRDWATVISDEDRARYGETLPPGPGGKPRWRLKNPCRIGEMRGLYRAMVIAAKAPDRASAEAIWSEVQRAYAVGEVLEQKMLSDARKSLSKRPTPLGRQLALRIPIDQAWREALSDRPHDELTSKAIDTRILNSKLCPIDRDNTQFLKSMIAKQGWPTISRDGADAAHDAWLLAQHADAEPDFQSQVLHLMEPLVGRREANGKDYALLFDRVALAEHRLQRYGTQFTEGRDGCLAVNWVEDHAGLDARRRALGLDTLEEYSKRLSDAYHEKVCTNIFDAVDTP